ncbi:MAG: type IV-A pilus assembly ATPase PilB [Acidiferrobacterales bacterium]|nr:type IV-A pilus assembly ATPase PilB [Acidiferrobacterales bacterium]
MASEPDLTESSAPSTAAISLTGVAAKMVKKGLLTQAAAEEINKTALQENRSFYLQCIEQNAVPVTKACEVVSEEFGIPMMDIDSMNTELSPLDLVPASLIEKHYILPLYLRDTRLFLGVSDPGNTVALDEVKFNTGLSVSLVLLDPRKLALALENILDKDSGVSLSDIVNEEGLDEIDLAEEVDEALEGALDLKIDTPIVRFVNKIVQDAIRRGASDIHIEPYETVTRIRFRIDGVLHDAINPPKGLIHKIIARLKILSQLDIAERRLPQDGRMKLQFSRSRTIDFRISTMPTLFGEKMVIRVLDTSAANLGLETIGMEPEQLQLYREAAEQPHGMILVTGPTGSGKTVSLYSALNVLNTVERNISSVEDPVEIYVNGINQVNVNERIGLTFGNVLRAFLRQDPDVVMIGEIRDLETAEIAVKASQTGHLVLSTLHTNDAPSSITRLVNMGIQPFNIASSVNLVIAQRLVRRLCDSCREPLDLKEEVLLDLGFEESELSGLEIYGAAGCSGCTGGYRGRTGIYEVMPMTPAISELVMTNCSTMDIDKQARIDKVATMRQSGLRKVAAGITSIEEVERVTAN